MFRAKLLTTSTPTFDSPSPSTAAGDIKDTAESSAWAFEMQLYLDCLLEIGLEGESLDKIFETNAKEVYGLR
jgi:hypothetical protein